MRRPSTAAGEEPPLTATREKPSQQRRSSSAKNKLKKKMFFSKSASLLVQRKVREWVESIPHWHAHAHALMHPSRMYHGRFIMDPSRGPFSLSPNTASEPPAQPSDCLLLPNPICQSRRNLSSLQLQRCKLCYNFAIHDFQQACKKASVSP